jgi:hypothetical protein
MSEGVGGTAAPAPEEEVEIPSTTTGFEASGQMAPRSAVESGLTLQAAGTIATLLGGLAISAPETIIPMYQGASAATKVAMQKAIEQGPAILKKVVTRAIASEAIHKARQIPLLGPIINQIPMAELIPWLGWGGVAASGAAKVAEEVEGGAAVEGAKLPEAFEGPGKTYEAPIGTVENPQQTIGEAAETAAKPTVADLESRLNESLGGRPLQPGVPMRAQGAAPQAAKAQGIPDSFTPSNSSMVKAYRYDESRGELATIDRKTGQTYVHAQVSPEEFKQFEGSKSHGQAWNALNRDHVIVRKNGVPTKPAKRSSEGYQLPQ